MKKIYAVIGTMMLTAMSYGQVNQVGDINIDLGFGFGIYNGSMTAKYQGITSTENSLIGASLYTGLNVEYAFLKSVSAGINYKRGFYVLDEAFDGKNSINTVGLSGRFYFLNRDQFAMFTNLGLNLSFLHQTDDFELASPSTVSYKWSGSDLGLGIGFKWFWTDNVGMHLAYEFNSYKFNLKSIEVDGSSDPFFQGFDFSQKASGSEFKIGVSLKIATK